jgi:hypothetical protein
MAHAPITPHSVRFAQVLGLTTSGFLAGSLPGQLLSIRLICAGYIASFSLLAVPTINLSPPALRAQQWKRAYGIGASTAPWLAVLATAAYGYVTVYGTSSPVFYHI